MRTDKPDITPVESRDWVDSAFFKGFPEFDCREKIWDGIFHANDSTQLLRTMLLFPLDKKHLSKSALSRKLSGENGWGASLPSAFFSLSSNTEDYRRQWLNRNLAGITPDGQFDFSQCRDVLQDFVSRYAEFSWTDDIAHFKPAADELRDYLATIMQHTANHSPAENREWLAAGFYSLVCLFLQNAKAYRHFPKPRFFRAPAECDPAVNCCSETAASVPDSPSPPPTVTLIPKNADLALPDEHPASFNLWDYLRTTFPESIEEDYFCEGFSKEPDATVLVPALVQRERISVSRKFTFPKFRPDAHCAVFMNQDSPIWKDNQWAVSVHLRKLPLMQDSSDASRWSAHLDADVFADEPICTGFYLAFDENCQKFEYVNLGLIDREIELGNRYNWCVSILHLNENGLPRDKKIERNLKLLGFTSASKNFTEESQPLTWTCKYDPEYLRFHLINPKTMEEIPKHSHQDSVTGEYRLSITIPCPCSLAVLAMDSHLIHPDKGFRLALEGYVHGLYGFEQDLSKACHMLLPKAFEGDPHDSFELGALLKKQRAFTSAKHYLEFAARHSIPSAKFELAELLIAEGNTETARQLIDDLWHSGYRTYGPTRSIDLLGDHPDAGSQA